MSKTIRRSRNSISACRSGRVSSHLWHASINMLTFSAIFCHRMKRLQQAKALKQKANKQLDALGRRHLRDVRIVRKDMVYVTEMKMKTSDKEEFLSLLRSNEYFGQYGKISKIFLRKGSSTSDPSANSVNIPSGDDADLGIYITYIRREDAARAIAALDGYPAPNNPGKTLKASYGSTKYCLSWLRGAKCEDGPNCMGMHEWAGEGDTFTRSDMAMMQHAIKDSGTSMDLHLQNQQRSVSTNPKASSMQAISKGSTGSPSLASLKTADDGAIDSSALPRSAHWAARPPPASPSTVQPPAKRKAKVLSLSSLSKVPTLTTLPAPSSTPGGSVPATSSSSSPLTTKAKTPFATPSASSLAASRGGKNSNVLHGAVGSTSSDRPSSTGPSSDSATPAARPSMQVLGRGSSTTRSASTTTSDTLKAKQEAKEARAREAETAARTESSPTADQVEPTTEPATPTVTATPKTKPREKEASDSTSPLGDQAEAPTQTSSPESSGQPISPPDQQPPYQPSVQAQAVVDKMMSRREGQSPVYKIQSPYPDFDDFLECFADGDFTYRLDAKLELEEAKLDNILAGVEDILAMGKTEAAMNTMSGGPSSYDGIFDPFMDSDDLNAFGGAGGMGMDDPNKKGSRFGFANRSSGGPPETAMSTLTSLMASSSVPGGAVLKSGNGGNGSVQDVRAFSQLNMLTGRTPRATEALSNPNYFAGLPGTAASRLENELMTPATKSALPFGAQAAAASPAGTHGDRASSTASMPPPPPGLAGSSGNSSFAPTGGYQQQGVNTNRNMQQAMEQQMMASMHGYQHQFQADGRRTASPGLQQALRGGNGSGGRYVRETFTNANGMSRPFRSWVLIEPFSMCCVCSCCLFFGQKTFHSRIVAYFEWALPTCLIHKTGS